MAESDVEPGEDRVHKPVSRIPQGSEGEGDPALPEARGPQTRKFGRPEVRPLQIEGILVGPSVGDGKREIPSPSLREGRAEL